MSFRLAGDHGMLAGAVDRARVLGWKESADGDHAIKYVLRRKPPLNQALAFRVRVRRSSISVPAEWWGALHRDGLWPPDAWFAIRYGVRGPLDWLWYRFVGHPVRLIAAAPAAMARRRQNQSALNYG